MTVIKQDKKAKNKLISLLFIIIINVLIGLYKKTNVNGNIENNKLINEE